MFKMQANTLCVQKMPFSLRHVVLVVTNGVRIISILQVDAKDLILVLRIMNGCIQQQKEKTMDKWLNVLKELYQGYVQVKQLKIAVVFKTKFAVILVLM